MKIKVLFVCMGNICRSPAGEAIFLKRIETENLKSIVDVDSAGIYDYHEGELADTRMRKHASDRGYKLLSRARKVIPEDGELYDIILAMDNSNIKGLKSILPEKHHHKIYLMNNFSDKYYGEQVPDPYYGGDAGFELVLNMLEDANDGLINEIRARIKEPNKSLNKII